MMSDAPHFGQFFVDSPIGLIQPHFGQKWIVSKTGSLSLLSLISFTLEVPLREKSYFRREKYATKMRKLAARESGIMYLVRSGSGGIIFGVTVTLTNGEEYIVPNSE